jgi:hypothetical protein
MLSVLTFIIGFLLGMTCEAKWKGYIQEKVWKEMNELAENMNKLGKSMITSQMIITKSLEEKKNENNNRRS